MVKILFYVSRVERTDRFKSERFPEDRSVLITSSRRNDREFRGNRVGRPRDGRRPGGRRERRYSYQDEDHDMNKVTERFTNPTYCPKDNRYFLVSVHKICIMMEIRTFVCGRSMMTEK